MTEWIEHQPPVKHDGGPCPCPDFLIVETWGREDGYSPRLTAKRVDWQDAQYWRPADPHWECSFDLDRLVAYRKKGAAE
jgi:hypothetical protein